MPIDVIIIKIVMAMIRYVLIKRGALVQLIFSQMVAINLLTSRATPIMIIGRAAAAKIDTRPATLYQTATALMLIPLTNANQAITFSFVSDLIELVFSLPKPIYYLHR